MEPKKDTSLASSLPNEKEIAHLRLVFGSESHIIFAYKKAEKLSTAIYLVTDFVKDEDPIKWRLRSLAVSLVSDILDKASIHKSIHARILEILSLLEMARLTRSISEMNHAVLQREFDVLIASFGRVSGGQSSQGNLSTMSIFSEDFFATPITDVLNKPPEPANISIGHSKGHILKDINTSIKDKKETSANVLAISPAFYERKGLILSAIKAKKTVAIQDLVSLIAGCSSKTIQRDLITLVSEGVLKKEGERRWSKYRLA